MKKTSPEPREEDKIPPPVPADPGYSSTDGEATDDPVASLQGDLDRFRAIVFDSHAALRIDDDFIETPPVTACLAPRSIENGEAPVVDENA